MGCDSIITGGRTNGLLARTWLRAALELAQGPLKRISIPIFSFLNVLASPLFAPGAILQGSQRFSMFRQARALRAGKHLQRSQLFSLFCQAGSCISKICKHLSFSHCFGGPALGAQRFAEVSAFSLFCQAGLVALRIYKILSFSQCFGGPAPDSQRFAEDLGFSQCFGKLALPAQDLENRRPLVGLVKTSERTGSIYLNIFFSCAAAA
jgi:hypothetical protein